MQSRNRQSGLTFISILMLLVILGFYVYLGLKLLPIYLEYYKVKSVVSAVQKENQTAQQTPEQIRQTLMNRFYINEVRRLTGKEIKIKSVPAGTLVEVEWEVREPTLGNVDMVVYFNEKFEIKNR